MSELPKGWVNAKLEEICHIIQGQSPPGSTYNSEGRGLPFFQGKADFGALYPTPRVWCDTPSKVAELGDILISIRAPVGPTNVADQRCCIGRGLTALRASDEIDKKFILHAIRYRERELASQATGSTFAAISGKQLRSLAIPLPPLPEQRRIVAEIEKQFTRLDVSESSINAVITKLKQLRQTIIEGACREFDNHRFVRFAELIDSLKNGISEKPSGSSGTPILKISAVRAFRLHLDECRFLASPSQYQDYELYEGDLLLTHYNGNRQLVGVCACVPPLRETLLYPDKLIRVRIKPGNNSKFYELMLNGGKAREHIKSRIRTTAGQSGISGADIKSAPVPLASLSEQIKAAEKFQDALSLIDHLEHQVTPATRRAHRLRQAILAKAFSGQLVPQDPSDEPVTVLLERIRSQRSSLPPKRTSQRVIPTR